MIWPELRPPTQTPELTALSAVLVKEIRRERIATTLSASLGALSSMINLPAMTVRSLSDEIAALQAEFVTGRLNKPVDTNQP